MPDVVDWLRRGAAPLAFRAQAVQDVDYRLACCVAAPNHDDVNMGLPLLALLVMVDVVNCVSERNLEDVVYLLLPIIEHVLWVADSLPELYLRLASVCRHAIISLSRTAPAAAKLAGAFSFYLRL